LKLASFHAAGAERIGVLIDGQLLDIGSCLAGATRVGPTTLLELVEGGEQARERLTRYLDRIAAGDGPAERFALDAVTWRAPVRRPSKICCLALNNSANAERIMQGPTHPAMFMKPASALLGHGGAIECRPEYGRTHPEPELAVVIGANAKNISERDAYDYVFGYTIHNDITSPTMRGEDTFHYRAIHPRADDPRGVEYVDSWVSYPGRYKCSDTFACMGPWLVTKDEIPDPHDLNVRCVHQGNLITEDNTVNLFYKIPQVLAFLSHYLTLWPGDIVSLGTALKKSAGGGAVQNVDLNRFGGPIEVSIDRLGTLVNQVSWV
jgi:2-keto-4-pentenoate hydratase/2-oxohepta-3-ene-1,7-dioic acid hydratase in catechol pathway